MRERWNFDSGWKFILGDLDAAQEPALDDSSWRTLHLPHDWSIEGKYRQDNPTGTKGGFLPIGIGWYRKTFEVTEEMAGKKIFIEFDGIYLNSDVWINGYHLGHRPNGYIGFEYDLTPHLVVGNNVIAVRVDHQHGPTGRWYTGSGINRHVWLNLKASVYIEHWGTSITTPVVNDREAEVHVQTIIRNDTAQRRQISLTSTICNDQNIVVSEKSSPETLEPFSQMMIEQTLNVSNPALWSPENPVLYKLKQDMKENTQVVDQCETMFGLRYFSFDANKGFLLNGKPTLLKGVCQHQDAGPVGTAVPDRLLEKRLLMLKDMGVNAIRTAHHPMAPEFYDMCDRFGFIVMNEAFDGWEAVKAPYDYGLFFNDWWEKDLGDFIRRDRNHPCVIMWSIGNEVKQMKIETTKKLLDFVHKLDPTRPVTCGVQQANEHADRNREVLDIAGYNEGGGACFIYERDHQKHPERVMVATEAPHTFQTRGFYRTQTWWRDKNQPRIEIENLTEEEIFFDGALQYNSSYDNSGVRTSARHSWGFVKKYPYLIGEFRWTGFDYLGESFGWPARMGNFGVIDAANFPKDHFYFYKSQFTTEPMIHMLPHWTHPGKEGVVIPVWVYTNCDEAELFLNGRSLGVQKMGEEMYLSWDVAYEPGELKAVGLRNGEHLVTKTFYTAGNPVGIKLHSDLPELEPSMDSVCQVSFEIIDEQGHLVPHADDAVTYHIEGPARLLGMENGDPLDLTPAQSSTRKAFYGMGMGLLQASGERGDIELTAAGILGDHIFEHSTSVSIACERLSLRGRLKPKSIDIYYTLDGTEPDTNAVKYVKPFHIHDTTTVKAIVFADGIRVMTLESTFTKGVKPKVIDLTHGNKPPKDFIHQGPISKEATGIWYDGEDFYYQFTSEGQIFKSRGGEDREFVGNFWYDYPADPFEEPDYAGTGAVKWKHGEEGKLALRSQEAKEMTVSFHDQILLLQKITPNS